VELDAVIQAVARSHQSYNGIDCAQRLSQEFFAADLSGSLVLAWECMAEREFIENAEELCALAPVATAPIRHHVLVCSGKSCSAGGSAEVIEAFERQLKERGILFGREAKGKNPKGSVILTECASVGFCAIGAAVMIYPDGVWYAQVRAADVPEIIEEHLVHGRVVERLALMQLPAEGLVESSSGSSDWEA
jgi:(2Fe-2S) ferredoxin